LDDTSQEWTADNINDEVVRSDINSGNLCRLVAVIQYNPVYFNNADSQAKIMFIDKDGLAQGKITLSRNFAHFKPWHSLYVKFGTLNKFFLLNID
jgi:hypothetical protein